MRVKNLKENVNFFFFFGYEENAKVDLVFSLASKCTLSVQCMNLMLGLYFHIDMIWINQAFIACIALLKATDALLEVTKKISKSPHSHALLV